MVNWSLLVLGGRYVHVSVGKRVGMYMGGEWRYEVGGCGMGRECRRGGSTEQSEMTKKKGPFLREVCL